MTYESFYKRAVCPASDAGTGAGRKSDCQAEGCGETTGNFHKIPGADYFGSSEMRLREKHPGTGRRLYPGQKTGRIHGGHDSAQD